MRAYYLVIDVGGPIGPKGRHLTKLHNDAVARKEAVSPIVYINGKRQLSASKR